MKVYIDSEFKCHTENPNGNFREVDNEFFDGKSQAFIESYRFVPSGEQWIRDDGTAFNGGGDMITPWKDPEEVDEDVLKRLEDAENALSILLGGNV